jgi:hypothetical protein
MARRKRRSVPARRRGTRKGMRRRTSRRAFTGLRRRRSNPKGILQQPAARNALWALGGASAEIVLNQTPLLQKQVKNRLARSAIFAALTIFIGQTMRGRVKTNSIAFGIGMLIPAVGQQVSDMKLGSAFKFGNNNNGQLTAPTQEEIVVYEEIRRQKLGNPGHSYGAAKAQVARISNGGLRAL